MSQTRIIFDQLRQAVPIHFRHLNVRDDQVDFIVQVRIVLDGMQIIPGLLAIGEIDQMSKTGPLQTIVDHFLKKHGILGNNNGTVANRSCAKLFHIGNLDRRLRSNLCHDLLKIQYRHQLPLALGNTGGHSLISVTDRFIRFLNISPGNTADPFNALHTECHRHTVEVGDNEQILFPVLPALPK